MKSDAFDLKKAINTTKISLSEEETKTLEGEMKRFLPWLKTLEEAETKGAPARYFYPTFNQVLRKDEPQATSLPQLKEQAQNFDEGFYLVPKVMD